MNAPKQKPNNTASKSSGFFKAAQNSIDGLRVLVAEKAVQRELVALLACCVVCAVLPNFYTVLLVVLALLLLAVEALNTAIETLCDHVTPEIHPMIKKVKDMGSAAVFIVSVTMAFVFVWVLAQAVLQK